jgi:hypothetical protein
LNPDESLPPYSYVPGRFPYPLTDPAGHSYGRTPQRARPLDPQKWQQSREFCHALQLFDAGYYWEAHEAWEALWLAAGRTGRDATALKGLIKLAAAGVKAREGNAAGVSRHARRAAELLQTAHLAIGSAAIGRQKDWAGLDLAALAVAAGLIADDPTHYIDTDDVAVKIVFPMKLRKTAPP